jgi:ABC-type transport system involved in multi-copper enzyme maturation permease subunit
MLTIAYTSLLEALRKKILVFIGIITIIYLGLFSFVVYKMMEDIGNHPAETGLSILVTVSQIVSFLGFYFSSMLVSFLAIMSSIGNISSEIENGTIHSIVTKPIRRMDYVLGKYLGHAVLIIVYSIFIYFSIWGICMFFKLPVMSILALEDLLKGLLFFVIEPLTLLSLSIFGGVYFKTLTNGIFVISIYILSLIGGMLEQIGAAISNNNLINIGIIASLVSPFDVIYRQMIAAIFSNLGTINPLAIGMNATSTLPSKWMNVYVGVYLFGLIFLTVIKFRKKDIS